jgi:3',5'-cyclic AMP phosphodiesterase CpdA
MKTPVDRRSFLRITGASIGVGALYKVGSLLGAGRSGEAVAAEQGLATGERPTPFSFVQLSDAHVGFSGPPNPIGTKAFEEAVAWVNRLPERPDLVLITGDLTHESEKSGEHADRMKKFRQIASGLTVKDVRLIPGEHDAGLDGGKLYRDVFGETFYSFDRRGVHFVGLDNVSLGKPAVGRTQLEWLKKDLSRFAKEAPIVVFTHRPLFDLKPEWEWFTSDGDDVMNVLEPFENVTVLYGHIHRAHTRETKHVRHYAARSLSWAFPDPASVVDKKPLPFDAGQPFKNLGTRIVHEGARSPTVEDVELTARTFAGMVGSQQFLKARGV